MSRFRTLPVVFAALIAVPTSHGIVVWSDDFTGQTAGAFPNRDFTGNSSNDYTGGTQNAPFFTVNAGVGLPGPALTLNDTNSGVSGAGGVLTLSMDEFAAFSTAASATPILNVSFDFKVDSFLSSTDNLAFRFILRANNSSAAGDQVVLAFNRGSLNDGDALTDLTFSIGSPNATSNFSATNSSAIGLIPGTGWLPGFDFGNYDSATAENNDTNGAFYNVNLSYDSISGGVSGSITRLAADATNGQSAPFTFQMNQGLDFSNSASDLIILASTDTLTGVSHFDNLVVQAIPEPSVAGALLLGVAVLGSRRRKAV